MTIIRDKLEEARTDILLKLTGRPREHHSLDHVDWNNRLTFHTVAHPSKQPPPISRVARSVENLPFQLFQRVRVEIEPGNNALGEVYEIHRSSPPRFDVLANEQNGSQRLIKGLDATAISADN